MKKYLAERLLSIIVTLLILSIFIFFLTHITAGDPASSLLGSDATPEQIDNLREHLGLNDPLPEQYIRWIHKALKGDLGASYFRNQTVNQAIADSISPTLELSLYAILFALMIAIPGGVLAARHKGGAADGAVSSFALLGLSLPSFILGLLLILFFGVKLKILPVSGFKAMDEGLGEHLKYMILPAITLGMTQAPLLTRITRSSVLEILNSDYIKTAKAKGLKERIILYKHAFRNALNTILTVLGQCVGGLIAGAAVVETIFNIPGMGQLVVNSVLLRDYPVIQGVVLVISVIYIVINFIIDLLYGVIDPRIRITGKIK